MPPAERDAALSRLNNREKAELAYYWPFWARPNQLPPPEPWRFWLLLGGRGLGKTRTGAEFVRDKVEKGQWRRIALVAATAADYRDTMIEGEAGLVSVSPPWNQPQFNPSKRELRWPNGAIAKCYSAEKPNRLRGPAHDGAWCDELAAWRYLEEAWAMLLMGLRIPPNPQCVITTTPRPLKLIKELLKDPTCAVSRGTSYENLSNLAPEFAAEILKRYEGTRLGRQELHAEVLDDTPGALLTLAIIDRNRVKEIPPGVRLVRVVVAVDPQATNTEESAETGIVVAARSVPLPPDNLPHYYVLADLSMKGTPLQWGTRAVAAFKHFEADRIVYESNMGGDMVAHVIRSVMADAPVRGVHASKGKQARAEPISAIAEQGRVHHVGAFKELEDQWTTWVPNSGLPSPDHLDASVWALTDLSTGPEALTDVGAYSLEKAPGERVHYGAPPAEGGDPDEDEVDRVDRETRDDGRYRQSRRNRYGYDPRTK